MAHRDDDARRPSAGSLFADWVLRHSASDEESFEALCREHPSDASELRELYASHQEVESARNERDPSDALSEDPQVPPGHCVEPQVAPGEGQPVPEDFSSEVLSRLAGRGPAAKRYHMKGEIAHGGMGAILRAWDEDLRRHLAMKVILGQARQAPSGDTPPLDRRSLARFLEEAQVTGQLEHPGIVPVHELGLDGQGRVYFTMKLVEGRTFSEVLELVREEREGWTRIRALGVIQKVCDAMAYAHSRGVVHRDLKPANVMVGRFGEVYVMDWGLARILVRDQANPAWVESERETARELDPASSLHTLHGEVMGTPAYMPPEQALGWIDEIGPASDVYAVGAMLYHLLAGHRPYLKPGMKADAVAIWQSVKAGAPDPLPQEAPATPAELVAICDRAMARSAEDRYPDMSALAKDLASYVEGRVVSAYEAGAWAEARKWVLRNKPLAGALASAVLAVALGGVAFALKAHQATEAAALAQDNLELAQNNEAVAIAQQKRAELSEQLAREETAKVLRLSDVKVLQELVSEADALWPAYPDKIIALGSWLDRARELESRLPGHRDTLAEMRGRAHPWSDEERARDRSTHPRAGELAEKRATLEVLIAKLEQSREGYDNELSSQQLEALEPEVAALTADVESRRTWSFDTTQDKWQHDVLSELIAGADALAAGLLAEDVTTANHGWSMPKRLAFAQRLEAGFDEGSEYAQAWAQALTGIRETYPGVDLIPQVGLLPIGQDPQSGLWEFAHLMTGKPAQRGSDGALLLAQDTGIVLILLPGGESWMGAQSTDPTGHNYDPLCKVDEGEVRAVHLSPFFISKYEMTQGQWLALSGHNPSLHQKSTLAPTLLYPVEQVSWLDCMRWLPRADLTLPTEAQWEYGARAGTETPWWTGPDRESLADMHAANLADRAAARSGARWNEIQDWPSLDDGFAAHAPAGTYTANGFGLHEVCGNVWEWCLDGYVPNFPREGAPADPMVPWGSSQTRVHRGGSFVNTARYARSAARWNDTPAYAIDYLGVRPARSLVK